MREALSRELAEAEAKAFDSLARYKFAMFGYWAGIWVHLNRITRSNLPNPFKDLVKLAREIRDGDAPCSVATAQKVRCPECALPVSMPKDWSGPLDEALCNQCYEEIEYEHPH